MKYHLYKQLVIYVHFTDEEFDYIDKCLKGSNEYKHLAEEPGPNHWWYNYSKKREWMIKDNQQGAEPMPFTFRNLDIILKCFEPFICFDWKHPMNTKLNKHIRKLLNYVNDYHSENLDPEIVDTDQQEMINNLYKDQF